MPGQRIRSDAADFVNLGERHSDRARSQDRTHLEALLRREPDGKEAGSDVISRCDGLALGGTEEGRAVRQIRLRRDDFHTARRDITNNGLGFCWDHKWSDVSTHREEHCSQGQQRCQDCRRLPALLG